MFNLNKQDGVKDKAVDLVNSVKTNVENVTNTMKSDTKSEAEQIVDMVYTQVAETKAQATGVIKSLESLLSQYTSGPNIHEIKDQIIDKVNQLKDLVKEESNHAYKFGHDRAVQTVQERPIASLAVALGTGVLLGYILGSKIYSK